MEALRRPLNARASVAALRDSRCAPATGTRTRDAYAAFGISGIADGTSRQRLWWTGRLRAGIVLSDYELSTHRPLFQQHDLPRRAHAGREQPDEVHARQWPQCGLSRTV